MAEIAELIRVGNLKALERGFDTLTQSIYELDPLISPLGYYQEVAKTLPYFIPSRTQERMFRAAASPSADVSRRAKGLILLVNLDTILTASSRFFRANDEDFNGELVQHSLTDALTRIDRFSRDFKYVSGFLHTATINASSLFVSQSDNTPANWIRRGLASDILAEIDHTSVRDWNELTVEAGRIAQKYSVTEISVADYLSAKFLPDIQGHEGDDQTFKEYSRKTKIRRLNEVIQGLPEQLRQVILLRYFGNPYEEIAEELGLNSSQAVQIKEKRAFARIRRDRELFYLDEGKDFTTHPVRYMDDRRRILSEYEPKTKKWYYKVEVLRPKA